MIHSIMILSIKQLNRFWSKVRKTKSCWIWNGARTTTGYGTCSFNNRTQRSHRISYLITKGAISNGLVLDHICRNRICVNPNHLRAITNRENILLGNSPMAKFSRRTKCCRGHILKGKNIIPYKLNGKSYGRRCVKCMKMFNRNRYL